MCIASDDIVLRCGNLFFVDAYTYVCTYVSSRYMHIHMYVAYEGSFVGRKSVGVYETLAIGQY